MTITLTCPVCNGSGLGPSGLPSDLPACMNCGGQTMSGKATGKVPARPDGTACIHDYQGYPSGRCCTRYVCSHCRDSFLIDSGG